MLANWPFRSRHDAPRRLNLTIPPLVVRNFFVRALARYRDNPRLVTTEPDQRYPEPIRKEFRVHPAETHDHRSGGRVTGLGARRCLCLAGAGLAAVTSTGTVVIWNARTGSLMARARPGTGPVNTLAFSPDGRLLATAGNDGDITLWDPASLRRRDVLAGPVGSVEALAFSPDSLTLASGEDNRTILLWDMTNGALTATLTSAPGTVRAVAFTPDGGTLISGDTSHRIIAWDLDPAAVARDDCLILARDPGLVQAETLVPGASYSRLCPGRS